MPFSIFHPSTTIVQNVQAPNGDGLLTTEQADARYLRTSQAQATYMTIDEAHGTGGTLAADIDAMQAQISAMLDSLNAYLTEVLGDQRYLKQTDAVAMLTATEADGRYLQPSAAANVYATLTMISQLQSQLTALAAQMFLTEAQGDLRYLSMAAGQGLGDLITSLQQQVAARVTATSLNTTLAGYATANALNSTNTTVADQATQIAARLTQTQADARYALGSALNGLISQTAADARYAAIGSLTGLITQVVADGRYALVSSLTDYLTQTAGDARYVRPSQLNTYVLISALSAYLTQSAGDARYVMPSALTGLITQTTADSRYAMMSALANYLTQAQGDARYVQLSALGTQAQIRTGSFGMAFSLGQLTQVISFSSPMPSINYQVIAGAGALGKIMRVSNLTATGFTITGVITDSGNAGNYIAVHV